MFSFEFDPKKSKSNLEKLGIDFVAAQELWLDVRFIELNAKSTEEPRSLIIGKIGSKHWSAIITYRSKNIRIISVRRFSEVEVALYES